MMTVFSCEGNCTLPVVDITAPRQEDGFHKNILLGDPKNALFFPKCVFMIDNHIEHQSN